MDVTGHEPSGALQNILALFVGEEHIDILHVVQQCARGAADKAQRHQLVLEFLGDGDDLVEVLQFLGGTGDGVRQTVLDNSLQHLHEREMTYA